MRRVRVCLTALFFLHLVTNITLQAQSNSYTQTNLTSDTAGLATNKDTNLVNPWGICFIPGNAFWISDNNSLTGVATLYDKSGALQGTFAIAPPMGSSSPATPTGCVANSQGAFLAGGNTSLFIFDTEDGTISGWTGGASSVLTVDNSANPTAATGAVYKGLALLSTAQGNFLLATNFRSAKVEVYDSTFKAASLSGSFADANPPAVPAGSGSPGYAPFGIHVLTINNATMIAVTYALQDNPKHDPMNIAGSGYVDLFDQNGNMVQRITDTHLNSPWGVVIPPASFGTLAGDLLVGNFGDGTINAFQLNGTFVGQMKDSTGALVVNASLWDMVFDSSGQTGDPKTMYISAGLTNEMHGLFAAITANATQPAPTPDFSVNATPGSQTITAGQNAQFTITLGGLNGFSSAVSLSCSGQPAGSSCSFAQTSLTPTSGGTITTTMTIMTSANPYMPAVVMAKMSGPGRLVTAIPVLTALFFALFVLRNNRKAGTERQKPFRYAMASIGIAVVMTAALAAGGCGGYGNGNVPNGTQRGATTVMITATSGNLSHSTSVSVTVQ
jgi:uncharacterized protein (TIGR03118 family)